MFSIEELTIMTFEVLIDKKVWLLSLKMEFFMISLSTSSSWINEASMFAHKLTLFESKNTKFEIERIWRIKEHQFVLSRG